MPHGTQQGPHWGHGGLEKGAVQEEADGLTVPTKRAVADRSTIDLIESSAYLPWVPSPSVEGCGTHSPHLTVPAELRALVALRWVHVCMRCACARDLRACAGDLRARSRRMLRMCSGPHCVVLTRGESPAKPANVKLQCPTRVYPTCECPTREYPTRDAVGFRDRCRPICAGD